MDSSIEFGYPWWLSYGHLVIAGIALAFLFLGYRRRWARTVMILCGAVALWAVSAFGVMRVTLNVNGRAVLPTPNFVASGKAKVLDMGAGTGRSTLMVLEARPEVRVVALDLFGSSFERHFGKGGSGEERLRANLRAAGVEERAEVRAGDMRKLPFGDAECDGVVSCYAIDHLNRQGIGQALLEARRVLRPGGEFLFVVISNDAWLKFAFGPLLAHGGPRSVAWWAERMAEAGLQVVERGTQPGSLYLVSRK